MAKDIHERIREKRREQGLTMVKLAEMCGLKGYQAVQQWEKPEGEGGTSPRSKTLIKLAEVLGVTPQWLRFGDDIPGVIPVESIGNWPFNIERTRFDQLPMREKQRAERAIRDIVETWEAEHAVEVRKAG